MSNIGKKLYFYDERYNKIKTAKVVDETTHQYVMDLGLIGYLRKSKHKVFESRVELEFFLLRTTDRFLGKTFGSDIHQLIKFYQNIKEERPELYLKL